MYGKLENGILTIAPSRLPGDGVVVYNPPAEMYEAQGWKPVTFTAPPEAPSGYTYESGWEEEENAIVEIWTLVELPDEIDDAEALDILLGGDGE